MEYRIASSVDPVASSLIEEEDGIKFPVHLRCVSDDDIDSKVAVQQMHRKEKKHHR